MVQSLGRGLFITAFVAFLAAGLCSTRLRVIEKEGDISHQRPPPPAAGGEAALIRRLLEGDEEAFGRLVEAYHARLGTLARAYVADPAAAEEVVQETWLAVLEGLPRFEGRSSLKTWIFRILANRAKTRAVREKRSIPFSALEGAPDEPAVDPSRFARSGAWADPPRPWDEETPERLLLNREVLSRIEEALDQLPEGQKAVVLLRDVEGLGAEETCNILEISETNQRVLLHRGRSKIRRALEEYLERKG